jgi:hypothetical protein
MLDGTKGQVLVRMQENDSALTWTRVWARKCQRGEFNG